MTTCLTCPKGSSKTASARAPAVTNLLEDLLLQSARCRLRLGEAATERILAEATRSARARDLPVPLVQLTALYRVLRDEQRWPWDRLQEDSALGDFLRVCEVHGVALVLRAAAGVSGAEWLVRYAALEAQRRADEELDGPVSDAYREDAELLIHAARSLRGEKTARWMG